MKILDSNIVIYATQENAPKKLLDILFESDSVVSEITKLEVLGYHGFTNEERYNMNQVFKKLNIIIINSDIINLAIELRQSKKMSAADSVVGATAILNNLELHTRNTSDFKHLPLTVVNPMI
jgi:toxin FitB